LSGPVRTTYAVTGQSCQAPSWNVAFDPAHEGMSDPRAIKVLGSRGPDLEGE
jgi:hypothetical protein